MPQKFVNGARSTLAAEFASGATAMTLIAGDGDLFPTANTDTGTLPATTDWFKLVLTNLSDPLNPPVEVLTEIVAVRTRALGSSVLSNVVREYETDGAGPQRTWPVGTVVRLALTAGDVEDSFAAAAKDWSTIPIQSNTTGRALAKADVGKTVPASGTVTLPANVFAKDDVVIVYNDSAANIAINKDAGVTMWWVNAANANRVLQPRGLASILCIRANEFVITGQGVE